MFAAERVVLPGQGAMPDCMRELRDSGLQEAVLDAAARKPLMGVCVGMQMLLSRSEEGPTDGLGLIAGEVLRFRLDGRLQPDGSRYKVPQMGWNRVHQALAHPGGRGAGRRLLLFRAQLFTPGRPTRATVRVKLITASALPARWRGITFSRPSSTPKRAPSTAWRCTATSFTGTPDFDPSRSSFRPLHVLRPGARRCCPPSPSPLPPPAQPFGHAADTRD